jgi:hypothetical protein
MTEPTTDPTTDPTTRQTGPRPALEVLEGAFLESRSRLLELAATLDRIDRAGEPERARADFRYQALRRAIELLAGEGPGRARALLLAWSDPTTEPIAAAPTKGAAGAWDGGRR